MHEEKTSAEQAQEALADVERLSRAGVRRGYSRGFHLAMSGWASVLALIVGFESVLLLPWLFAGLAGFMWYRRGVEVWPADATSSGQAARIIVAGLVAGTVIVAGGYARSGLGIPYAPWISASILGVGLSTLSEWSYGRTGREAS